MRAGNHNFTCEQGSTFIRTVEIEQPDLVADPTGQTFAPYDLTGHSARMQVRRTVTTEALILDLTTDNGALLVNPADKNNEIKIYIADESTASIAIGGTDPLIAVYDLEIENQSGEVSRVLQGNFTVIPEVTR